jgi:hypothetical protein
MRLQDDLRAAVDDAPPPLFELDQIIRRGRARRTRSRLLFGTAGLLAVTLAGAAGYATATGWLSGAPADRVGTPTRPTPAPPAGTTEAPSPEQMTVERLTAALGGLPPSLRVPADGSVRFRHHADVDGGSTGEPRPYFSAAWSADHLRFTITVKPDTLAADDDCAPGQDPNGCVGHRDENGLMYVTGGDDHFSALYFRNDGTSVEVSVLNWAGENGTEKHPPIPTSLRTDVRAAAKSPGLTLFH